MLLIGVASLVLNYVSGTDSWSDRYRPKICEGATDYKLTPTYREVEIDIRPDCWSGEVTADYVIYWGFKDSQMPYEARFAGGDIYKGNSPESVINERVKHSDPIRFRGTGKMKASIVHFENSVSHLY